MADENVVDPQDGNNPDERPSWLPDNFKTPEDLVKSYNEAQNKIREQGTEINAINENYAALADTVEQLQVSSHQAAQQQQVNPLIAQYQDAYERGDATQMLAVNAEISKLAVQQALAQALPQVQNQVATLAASQAEEIGTWAAQTLEARYGAAWDENRQAVRDLLDTQSWLIPEEAKTNPQVALAALDNVFKIATHGNVQPAQDAAAAQAEAERARLLAAQTATGAGTRTLTGDEAKQEWDAIKGSYQRKYWE